MLIRKIEEVDYQDVYQLVKYELGSKTWNL